MADLRVVQAAACGVRIGPDQIPQTIDEFPSRAWLLPWRRGDGDHRRRGIASERK